MLLVFAVVAMDFNSTDLSALSTLKGQEEFYDSSFRWGGSFGIRVSKTGKKVFFLVFHLNGRRKRITLGNFPVLSLQAAHKLALDALRKAEDGRDPAAEKRYGRGPDTFAGLANLFLSRHAEALKAATAKEYRRIIERELLPRWKDVHVRSIQRRDVIDLLEAIAKERRTPVMANRIRALISKIFNFGVSRGIVDENPAADTSVHSAKPRPYRVLSGEEIRRLWKILNEIPSTTAAVIRLLLLTGQRPSEVMGMRWKDLSFDTWTIPLPGERQRIVPLSPQCLFVLRPLRTTPPAEFVFPAVRSKGPIMHIRKAMSRLGARAEFKPPISPSALRNTVEFHMAELGIRPDVIAAVLGREYVMPRLRSKNARQYDYSDDVRNALLAWGRKVATFVEAPAPKGSKVIRLFR